MTHIKIADRLIPKLHIWDPQSVKVNNKYGSLNCCKKIWHSFEQY